MLLFPAFRLQEKMQKMTLGERTWVKINEKIQEGRRMHVCRMKHHCAPADDQFQPDPEGSMEASIG